MKQHVLVIVIAITLLFFVMIKVAANLLCEPRQNNVVVNTLSSMAPAPKPSQGEPVDPLSWGPIFQRFVGFLSKACNK